MSREANVVRGAAPALTKCACSRLVGVRRFCCSVLPRSRGRIQRKLDQSGSVEKDRGTATEDRARQKVRRQQLPRPMKRFNASTNYDSEAKCLDATPFSSTILASPQKFKKTAQVETNPGNERYC